MIFSKRCLITFSEIDSQGILFFSHVLPLCHKVYEEFILEKINISWNNWFQNPEWFLPIRKVEVDYFSPIFGGQFVDIRIKEISLETHSFSLFFVILTHEKIACEAKTVHVFCDQKTKKKIAIPCHIREKIESLYANL